MGLLSVLKRGLGTVVEAIGNIFDNDKWIEWGQNLVSANLKTKKAADLDSDEATIQDTIYVHKICNNYINEMKPQIKKCEATIIQKLRDEVKALYDPLSKLLPCESLNELKYLVGNDFEEKLKKDVQNYISSQISQDNQDFNKILKISDTVDRDDKLNKYAQEVSKKAQKRFEKKANEQKYDNYQKTLKELTTYFSNQKNLEEEAKKNREDIERCKQGAGSLEDKAIEIVTNISYLECIRTLTYSDK